LTSSAFRAKLTACGGFSSASVRADPSSAGTHFGSACSAIWNDFNASFLMSFSRNSSPHAV
jgi:hypothetical protein